MAVAATGDSAEGNAAATTTQLLPQADAIANQQSSLAPAPATTSDWINAPTYPRTTDTPAAVATTTPTAPSTLATVAKLTTIQPSNSIPVSNTLSPASRETSSILTKAAAAQNCPATPVPFIPTKFEVPSKGLSAPVLNLGFDAAGTAAAAPPEGMRDAMGWFNAGPMVGSKAGKVDLTAHTYANGSALGNRLTSDLTPGDVIIMSNAAGNSACYEYTGSVKINVASYDSKSTAYYSATGNPQLAIMTCADLNMTTYVFESRTVLYASLIVR